MSVFHLSVNCTEEKERLGLWFWIGRKVHCYEQPCGLTFRVTCKSSALIMIVSVHEFVEINEIEKTEFDFMYMLAFCKSSFVE